LGMGPGRSHAASRFAILAAARGRAGAASVDAPSVTESNTGGSIDPVRRLSTRERRGYGAAERARMPDGDHGAGIRRKACATSVYGGTAAEAWASRGLHQHDSAAARCGPVPAWL